MIILMIEDDRYSYLLYLLLGNGNRWKVRSEILSAAQTRDKHSRENLETIHFAIQFNLINTILEVKEYMQKKYMQKKVYVNKYKKVYVKKEHM